MAKTLHAFDLLRQPAIERVGVVALFGSERFLQLEASRQLIEWWGGGDAEFSTTRFDGTAVAWRDVHDELHTASLFSAGGTRLVVVDDADDLIKRHRAELESVVGNQRSNSNVLMLLVTTLPSNTRLYKGVVQHGLAIDCNLPTPAGSRSKAPDTARILEWLIHRAEHVHGFQLKRSGAQQLLELNEIQLGLYDQQLAQLACFGTPAQAISDSEVRQCIGGWRDTTVWQMVDAAMDAQIDQALGLLRQLLGSGQDQVGVFAQAAWSLRRYANAIEIRDRQVRQGRTPKASDCLIAAGFNPYWTSELNAGESRLNSLGLRRGRRLLRLLYDADKALKSSHSADDRGAFVLERLLLSITQVNTSIPAASR